MGKLGELNKPILNMYIFVMYIYVILYVYKYTAQGVIM